MTSPLQQIVASVRGGRMTKWKGCVASAAPYMLVATVSTIALSSSLAHAETISTDVVGPQVLAFDEDHEITATGSVTLTSTSDAAVLVDGDFGNSFTNNGAIEVTGTSIETALGLLVDGNLLAAGQIVNNGTIALDHTQSDVESYGITVSDDADGIISNTGSITLTHNTLDGTSPNNGGDFDGYGISARSLGTTGQINNSGTVQVIGRSLDDASASGIYLDTDSSGAIINSGTVQVEVSATDNADAFGINIGGTFAGTVTNSGTIITSAFSDGDDATADGILVDGEMLAGSSLTNSGTIDVNVVSDGEDVDARGIQVDDDLAGAVLNTGTITVSGVAFDDTAEVYGILIDGDALTGGSVTNTGTITAFGSLASGGNVSEVYGIEVSDDLEEGASLLNSGNISATATAEVTEAQAYALHIDGAADGTVTNNGTLSATAITQANDAEAFGIFIDGDLTSDVDNSGDISATSSSEEAEAYAYGLAIDNDVEGSVVNSGSITATAVGENSATVYGLTIDGELTGSLTNSGTISANATDATSSAEAYGIVIDDALLGSLTNSGTITATVTNTADGDAGLYAIGMDISNVGADATVANSGSISAVANNVGAATYVTAYGIDFGTVDGTVTNSGTISATSTNDADVPEVEVVGVYASTLNGELSNTGTIAAQSDADTDQENVAVYALWIDELNGEITDAGTITATGSGEDVYAIFLGGGTGTLNLDTDNDITGKMSVAAHDINLFASGRSTVFAFEDRDTGAGVFDATVASDNLAWFVADEGGAAPIYASVNSADLDVASATVATYGDLLGALGDAIPSGDAPAATRNLLSFGGGALSGMRPFVSAGVESSEYEGVDDANDSDAVTADVAFGYAGRLQSGLGLSVGVGVFGSEGSSGPSDFESTGYFAGATVDKDLSGFVVEGGIGFGTLTTDNTREIAGSTDAESDTDSTFATVHLGVSREFSTAAGLSWTGFGEVRYTSQNVDGYTETDSLANATVDDFTVATTQAIIGVEAAYVLNDGSAFTGALSAVSRTASGDDEIDVTVFDATASLASVASDFSGSALSIAYERDVASAGKFNIGAAQEFGDGATGPTFSASLAWSF